MRDIVELRLCKNSSNENEWALKQVEVLERRIFPKHESMSTDLRHQLQRPNCTLLYALQGTAQQLLVAGYVIIVWASRLAASISKLAVRDMCRREGYGEALMQAAIQMCRLKRIQCVNLHVDPERLPAFSLYKKLGFTVDTLVSSYYAPGRDAYRMVLELS